MIKHYFRNPKRPRYQRREFPYITFLYRTNAKAYAHNDQVITHSQREIEVSLLTLKNSPSNSTSKLISSKHKPHISVT